jgi:hypothetical protein
MEPERLDDKLLIRKCPHRFARVQTRPPLLSSATRLPGAKLAGVNAQPPYGFITALFNYLYTRGLISQFQVQATEHTRWLGAHFTVSP